MKKLLLLLGMAFLAMGSLMAQPNFDPAERLKRELDAMTSELGLSKDQVAKVTPILTAAQKKQMDFFSKMRESGDFDRDKMREERTKMMAETDKALKAVLTADQSAKLDAFRKKQAEERAKRMQMRQQ